ncbi:MAG: hypothetical protein R6V12_12760, partial [Candidatus Hydrogenedentota bacterium]
MKEISVRTTNHTQFVNIDGKVQEAIAEAGLKDGICHIFVPHTTEAAASINMALSVFSLHQRSGRNM